MKIIARLRDKLSYSNVVASLALFVALGGAAVAAGLAKNSVGTKQLKPNAVTAAKIKNGAVNSHKLAHGAVVAGKLGANSISSGVLQNESVLAAKLAKNSVTNAAIANGVVGTNKLGNGVVTTAKLADGSVTAGKLGPEVAPLLGTLKAARRCGGSSTSAASGSSARAGGRGQLPVPARRQRADADDPRRTARPRHLPRHQRRQRPDPAGRRRAALRLRDQESEPGTEPRPGVGAERHRLGFGLEATAAKATKRDSRLRPVGGDRALGPA